MKVFIVGAGFSKKAGYPLGSEILSYLRDYVEEYSKAIELRDYWNQFDSWRNAQVDQGILEIIDTGNVEFIVTYLDMLEHANDFNRTKYYKAAKSLGESELEAIIYERQRKLEETGEFFLRARIARDRLKRLLVNYFEHQHCQDRANGNYEYVLRLCEHLIEPGDVFISFNYDSLVERSLLKLDMWSPGDGYGFKCSFVKGEPWDNPVEIDLGQSPVKVFKLHGSVGWYENKDNGKIFLNWGVFLQHFLSTIRDSTEFDVTPHPYEYPVVIEPSFIKPIEQRELLDVWDEAKISLEKAEEVFILGYSMPEADASANNLIVHSLRAKTIRPKVTIVNPDKEILDRYEELLGFPIEKQRFKVEDWVNSLVIN